MNDQPNFNDFANALGNSPAAQPPTQNWADKLSSLYSGQSNTQSQTEGFAGNAGSDAGTTQFKQSQPGFFSSLGSTLKTAGSNIVNDFKGAFSSGKSPVAATEQAAQGGYRVAGDIGSGIANAAGNVVSAVAPGIPHAIQAIENTPWGQGVAQRYQAYAQAHPDAAKNLEATMGIINGGATVAGGVEGANAVADVAPKIGSELAQTGSDIASGVKNTVGNAVSGAKESISPSLTPTEKIGSIVPNAKLGDVPIVQRTFDSLPATTGDVTKMSPQDLSSAVDKQIQSNLKQASAHYASDTSGPRPMSSFEIKSGSGTNAVTTNPVKEAIDQLKAHYTVTNEGQGKALSNIKSLEEKANTIGLTSKELDALAKEHGRVMPSAFSKTGEPLTGLNKQATENTRSGVKATARGVLAETNPEAAKAVTKLDMATHEGIHTKDLLDKQAETQNTAGQKSLIKNGKPGIVSKVQQYIKQNPVKSFFGGYAAEKALKGTGLPGSQLLP